MSDAPKIVAGTLALIEDIKTYLGGGVVAIAGGVFVWNLIHYIKSSDEADKIRYKKRAIQALIGAAIAVSANSIISFILSYY